MPRQLSLDIMTAEEWVSAFDGPEQPMCACRVCRCRDEAENGRICALCYYGVHVWEK